MFGEMLCANSEMFVEHFEVKAEKHPGRLLNKFPAKVKRLDFSIWLKSDEWTIWLGEV